MNDGERRGGSEERQGHRSGYNNHSDQRGSGDFRNRSADRQGMRRGERPASERRCGGEDTRAERRDGGRHYTGAARRT